MDALEWMVRQNGVKFMWHYLDDFITYGDANSQECHVNLQMLIDVCKYLGVPLVQEKVEGPSDILGIVIDTVRGELWLPVQKLEGQLVEWLRKKK